MIYNILYIDDEVINLRVFKSVFRREYNVLIAHCGEDGLRILDENDIHLIITDQRMPNMTGVEFLKKVQKKIPTKPPNRIILSGFSKSKDIDVAKEKYSLYMFISKPWDVDDLRDKMNEAIEDAICNNVES